MDALDRVPHDLPAGEIPQEIYVLDLKEIVKGAGPELAKPVVWQFLRGAASGPAIAADVAHPQPGKQSRLTSLARGPLINKSIESSRQVEKLPEVKRNNYELRRLSIPGLSIRVFWLKSLEAGVDLAVPYHNLHREIKDMQPYPMPKFMRIVKRLAVKRLKFDDSPRPKR
ncbi:MAG TPA: hypothetical protein VNX18_13315 [Bryobacteraceae bacterium]|nr:hypothetical protein [Bryobacteraceae bacterium]